MDETSSPTRSNRVNKPEDMSSAESVNSESSDDSSDDSDESGTESSQSEFDTNSNESDDSKPSINKNKNNSYQAVKIDNQKADEQIHNKESQCDNHLSDQQNDDTDKESNEEDDFDDQIISRCKSTINFKKQPKKYYDQIVENFPDAIRRSSRSRKEPERFQAETYDSDQSDSPKSNRKQRKRKDSDEWMDHNNHDGEDDDEADEFDGNDTESSEQEYKHTNRRLRQKVRPKSNNRNSSRNRSNRVNTTRGTSTKHGLTLLSNSETEEEEEDDDDNEIENENNDDNDDSNDDSMRKVSTSRASNRKKTFRRTVNPVSYKEESDSTDSDDLIEVGDTPDDSISGQAPMGEFEEEGEMIEKVLEHRLGRINATGPKTASYQMEEHGDPNANLTEEEPKEMHFLIKWKGWSYIHCTWESKDSLAEQKARGVKKIELYLKRDEDYKIWKKTASPEDIDYYEGQEELNCQLRQLHLNVERIIAHQPPKIGLSETCHPEYLCKWEGLPYGECTWEDGALIMKLFSSKVNEYYQREKSQNIPIKFCRVLKQRPKFLPMKNQPSFIGGKDQLELRDYQLYGLNWLAQSWCRNNSVILADEMGLGKTIQTISFLNYLYHQHNLYGPFLLVVPLSTLAAWQKEFENWAPTMNVVAYTGDATSRHMIRQYEWSHSGNQSIKFNVLLTTYEILLREKAFLSSVSWAVLGVDEAHRLKNDESFLYKCLYLFHTNYRLLITGTPLQNSLRELWALLHFIMPDRFESWEDFESEHKDAYHHGFSKLHAQLKQFLLRRVKKDVEKSLPAKVEQILRVDMTSIQKQYYKWILTKNYKALSKGVKGSISSFTNIIMELKKCCNHAGLVRPIDEYAHLDPLQKLIRGSGKLLLLDKLLCRLKETGHRVLIFSQMVRMLDILGEYLSLRRFPYQRLDGSVRGEFRKQALEHFNAEGSQDFCFLLSTRAGGLGINLATADTVIIFDSDWNPQNDLQAQARAHRIGQKNQVNIYRLVTRDSVEENIIERAKRKMVLDHLVIQRMDTSGHTVMRSNNSSSSQALYQSGKGGSNNTTPFNKEELAAILKFGAGNLFNKTMETENGDEEPQCDIDEILKRAETREDDGPQTLGDELLSSFKVASFNFNEEEDVQALCPDDATKSWDEIIPESERLKFEQDERDKEEMKMMMLPRSRNKSNKMSGDRSDSGEEYDPMAKNDSPGSEDSDSERPRRRGRPKSSYKELIKGFSEQEVRRFIKSYKKFPTPLNRLESIAIDAELQEKPLPDLHRLAIELERNCHMAIEESEKDEKNPDGAVGKKNNRGPSFKLGGATVFARSILSNQKDLEPLDLMLPSNADERKKWMLTGIKVKSANWDRPWSIENDSRLLAGVYEYGLGNWEAIKMDPSYQLTEKILPDGELKPQAKQLQSRVEYLLKLMHRHLMSQKKLKEEPKTTKAKKSKSINEKMNNNNNNNNINNNNNNNGNNCNNIKMDKCELSNSAGKTHRRKLSKDKEKHRKKRKEKKKDRKKEKKKNLTSGDNCSLVLGELGDEKFKECKEKMRAMKKTLKAFNEMEEQQQKLSKSQRKEAFYELVATIGAHIDSCLVEYQHDSGKTKEWRNNLWTFVARFTEFPAKKLYKFYRRVKSNPSNRSESSKSLRGDQSPSNSNPQSISMGDGYHSGGGHESSSQRAAIHYRSAGNHANVSIRRESSRFSSSGSAQNDSSNKRDYHSMGSGSGGPVKFAKHSYHPRDHYHSSTGGRTLDYGHQSMYGHASSYYSVSAGSSKYDGYRNHGYDHGRYNNNTKNNYYGRNDHHRSERPLIDRYDQRNRSFHRNSSNEYRSGRNEMLMQSGHCASFVVGGPTSHLNNGSAETMSNPASIVVNHSTATATGLMTHAKVTSNYESDLNHISSIPSAALLPTPPLSLAPPPSINIHQGPGQGQGMVVSPPNAAAGASALTNIR